MTAGRSTGAALAVAALLVAAPRPMQATDVLRGRVPTTQLTDPLVAAVSLLAWALAAWLLLTALLTCGSRLAGPSGAACSALLRRTAPAAVRQAVALALGVGVVLGSVGTANAVTPTADAARQTSRPAGVAISSFDWPVAVAPVAAGATATAPPAGAATGDLSLDWPDTPTTVVVEPGDSLWALAARHLPSSATDAEIAAAWPSWWSANRSVIGDDPDLLHPGQRLQPPGPRTLVGSALNDGDPTCSG